MVITVTPLGAVRSFMAPALIRGGVPIAALAVGMIGAVALPLAWGRLELGKLMTSMSRAADQASPPDNVPAPRPPTPPPGPIPRQPPKKEAGLVSYQPWPGGGPPDLSGEIKPGTWPAVLAG